MSFDALMEEAWNIRDTAVRKAVQRGEAHPDYARVGVESYFDQVPSWFEPYAQMPDPAGYRDMIEDMRAVLERLSSGQQNDPINSRERYYANPRLAGISTASTYLAEWDGPAAAAFKRHFLDPFPQRCSNQFILAAICKSALEAHQAMWDNARKNIDSVVHTTLDALEKRDRCDKNEWTITFTVLAGICAIAVVPLTAATVVGAATVTAVGAAAQVAAAQPMPEEPVTYQGEAIHQIIAEMRRAIDKVGEDIKRAEQIIVAALRSTLDTISGQRDLFIAPRPALADAHPGNIAQLMGNPD